MAAPAFNTASNTMNVAGGDVDLKLDKAPDPIKEKHDHFLKLYNIGMAENDASFRASQDGQEELHGEEFRMYHYKRDCERMGTAGDPKILDAFTAKIRIVKARLKNTAPKRGYLGYPRMAEFISRIRPASLIPADLKPLPGPATLKMLDSATAAVDAAFKTRNRAESAPRTLAYGLDSLKSEISAIRAAVPNVRPLFEAEDFDGKGQFEINNRAGSVAWPRKPLGFHVDGNIAYGLDILGVLAWLFPDLVETKLTEMVKAAAPKSGMEIADKATAVADAHEKVVAALRFENEVLIALEKAGTYKRTRSIHPACALGIQWNAQKIAEYID